MATRSKWAGHCHLCDEEIAVGAPGARFLGKWVHDPCKALRVAEIAAQGRVEVLPEARGLADVAQTGVRIHSQSRKGWQSRNNVRVG